MEGGCRPPLPALLGPNGRCWLQCVGEVKGPCCTVLPPPSCYPSWSSAALELGGEGVT